MCIENLFDFEDKVVAKRVEAREGGVRFRGFALCMESQDVCATNVEFPMQRIGLTAEVAAALGEERFRRHPSAKTALDGIKRGRNAALAMQEGFNGTDPGAVFFAGIE